MKKILFIIVILLLIGTGLFFLFGGRDKLNQVFNNEADFGTFFDINTPSQNNPEGNIFTPEDPLQDPNQPYQTPVLRQISFEPVSGFTFYATSSTSTVIEIDANNLEVSKDVVSTSTVIRFQERATGHIYDVFEFSPIPKIVSNITISKVYQTIFTTNPNEFIYKTLSNNNEQIISKRGVITVSTSTDPTTGEVSFETRVSQLDLSSFISDMFYNQNKIIYSIKQDNQTSVFTANTNRTEEKLITTLPFNEFILGRINQNEALITTKASRGTLGYSYVLNLTNGSFSKILGDIRGLLALVSPSKEFVLYSESNQSRPITRLLNTSTGVSSQIAIDTLPSEKCVFSQTNTDTAYCFGSFVYRAATYPDDWYKGKITNIETLYQISLLDGSAYPVFYFNTEENNVTQDFDIMNVSITSNDSHIIFQNKNDLTLWAIDLIKMNTELF